MNGTGLVRQPSSRLAEGIVTHITRIPVDVALARAQHTAYAEALGASGWAIEQAPAADDCPDSVFIEDTVVICEDLAVLTRPGTPARRPEVAGVAQAVSEGRRLVVLFDELFKGTNVKDAYHGTLAVTEAFSKYRRCVFIISTHIVEAGEVLRTRRDNLRFAYLPTILDNGRPRYPYILKEGIAADRVGMTIIENEKIIDIITQH